MGGREHLIVVLPGIGGSVLAPQGMPDSAVWSAGFGDVGNIVLRPERLSVGEHEFLDPVGLIRTRKAFGVWTAIPGYDGLLGRLGELPGASVDDGSPQGRDLDASVVAVPYDFRRSIVEAARRLDDQVRSRLARLWPTERACPRVVIVAHSLGGLVARYWLAQEQNWPLCRALITLGTPHRGAPKALDVLSNGVPVVGLRITRPVAVLREWASVAELLPRYPAVLDVPATATANEVVLRRPHELALPWLHEPATEAWAVHEGIEAGWAAIPRTGPEMIPRIGYGHGTPRRCTFDGHRIRVTTGPPDVAGDGDGLGAWVSDRGDGTVPAFSGLPVEMDRHSPRDLRVTYRHGQIADLDELTDILESYEGRPPRLPTRGVERPVVLGLGLDEIGLAGAPIDLTVRITGTDADVRHVAVWASLTDPRTGVHHCDTALTWDDDLGEFRGELPTAGPGVARVVVVAEAVPGGADLESSQLVEVFDGDQLS